MDRLDGLQGTHHDLEVGDEARLVPLDHVDPIDENAVHLGLELQHGLVAAIEDTDIAKAVIAERFTRRMKKES